MSHGLLTHAARQAALAGETNVIVKEIDLKAIVAVIEWYGPYTFEEAQKASRFDYDDGLYMVVGKRKNKQLNLLQYIGIATYLNSRLSKNHHKIPKVTRDQFIWLGEVTSPRSPGKKLKVTDKMLDLAEWAHVYFLQLPLNKKKKANPPDRAIIVYNRWWQKDYETQYLKRPHKDWPDIIDFQGTEIKSKLVWFGNKQVVGKYNEIIR